MFFNSINEINRLRKQINGLLSKKMFLIQLKKVKKRKNRLLSKGMSNIYLKVTIETFQKFDALGLKNLSPGQFLGSSNSPRYH